MNFKKNALKTLKKKSRIHKRLVQFNKKENIVYDQNKKAIRKLKSLSNTKCKQKIHFPDMKNHYKLDF